MEYALNGHVPNLSCQGEWQQQPFMTTETPNRLWQKIFWQEKKMKTINVCREIARQVVLAQIASDAGKGINELPTKSAAARKAQYFGYAVKDRHIQNAINLINKNPLCGFIYWVTKSPDQNGNPSKIIYFKYNQRQISFHSFGGGIIKTSINKGGKQRWDKSSSRQNCLLLIDEFNL